MSPSRPGLLSCGVGVGVGGGWGGGGRGCGGGGGGGVFRVSAVHVTVQV